MAQFSKEKWPTDGPVRVLLCYMDDLHRQAGQPPLTEMGRAVSLAPSTLSAFFTGARLIGRGSLERLVEHLGGDVEAAERLRRGVGVSTADVRVLGPIVVIGPHGPSELPGVRCRTLLALLALNANRVVSSRSLIDALYGEDPPRTALRSLHSYVSRVRQALHACGLSNALHTHGAGYLLSLPRSAVDAHRFEEAVGRGRAHLSENAIEPAIEHLQAGLDLWRGEALADGETNGWAAAEVDRLHEVRLDSYEDLWDARLRQGADVATAEELERLLVRHPTRERLVGLLMLALCRTGRPAAALTRYEQLRRELAEELGVDPGPRLRELHAAILRDEVTPGWAVNAPGGAPPGVPVARPAQLPPAVGHFTGRADALAELADCLDADQGDTKLAIVSGPAGIGKTAFAVHWAHQIRSRFPDGQLFLDLRGHDPEASLTPADVLTHVLRGLGVPADRVPSGVDEQVPLYRSIAHDRRILLVLDNAGTADHVAYLIPPTSSSMLVTTSRRRLTALAVHHPVRLIELGVLAPEESVGLLCRIIGARRVAQESAATADLARLCGYTPLALRIVAANLTARPRQRIADLVGELAGESRLDALAVEGDPRTVRAVFMSAYETLSEPAAQLFRRLGLHPGASFSLGLAAALDDRTPKQARRLVDELAASHLVTEIDSGRYRLHDLIQVFARERLAHEETDEQRAAMTVRLLDWYLGVADAANRILDPGRDRVVVTLRHPQFQPPFAAEATAVLSYLDSEYDNIRSVVSFAASHREFMIASQLSYLIAGYFDSRGHAQERIEIYRAGLVAATRLADPAMEGLMCSGLGVACIAARQFDEALVHLRRALELMLAAGDKRGEGHVYNNIAVALGELRRYDEAIAASKRALAVHDANGHEYGMIIALNNQGHSYARTGQYAAGLACLDRALVLARHLRVVRWEAWVMNTLGEAHRDQGHLEQALDYFEQSLRLRRQTDDRSNEALTLLAIGATQLRRSGEAAAATFAAASQIGEELADRHLVAMALAGAARAALLAGDMATAQGHAQQALALRTLIPDWYEEAELRRTLGELAVVAGDRDTANVQWSQAIDLYRRANAPADAEDLNERREAVYRPQP